MVRCYLVRQWFQKSFLDWKKNTYTEIELEKIRCVVSTSSLLLLT